MDKLLAWIVAFMLSHAAPGRVTHIPEAEETKEEALARYDSIARDVAQIVSQEEPLFKGPTGRVKTASILLAIMQHESGFRKDVDLGLGSKAKGDHGRSACMMQLNIGNGRTIPWNTAKNRPVLRTDPPEEISKGWNQAQLLADRKKCIRAGYRMVKLSFGAAGRLPTKDWLRVYASGSTLGGEMQSQSRMSTALRYFDAHKPAFKDEDFLPKAEPSPTASR